MSNYQIKNLNQKDIPAIMQVQQEYARHYPGVQVMPGDIYLSPAFHQGKDVFCAYHPNGQMLGFGVVYAQLSQKNDQPFQTVWSEVRIVPEMNRMIGLREILLEHILRRIRELTDDNHNKPIELNFQYFPYEVESIAFITSKGFTYTGSIFSMQRDLNKPLPSIQPPPGFVVKPWKLESQEEREIYVKARNLCFPNAPISLEEWVYFMSSPSWSTATNFAVFDTEKLAGCLTAYWDEEQNRSLSEKVGYTEYIFVCPQWRRQGLASALIAEALGFLRDNGLRFAQLQVKTDHRNALELYEKLGFTVNQESGLYTRQIDFNYKKQ